MKKLLFLIVVIAMMPHILLAQEWEKRISVRTNLLYDAVSAINLGFEIPIGKGFAFEFDAIFPDWVDRKSNKYALQIEMIDAGIRKYSAKHWYGGVYAQYGKACIQYNPSFGYRVNDYKSVGAECGYLLNLSEHFAMDFGVEVGYNVIQYDMYRVEQYNSMQYLASQDTWRKKLSVWFCPASLCISIIYMIGGKDE